MSDKIERAALGNNIIVSTKIADGSITAEKIAPNTITATNLNPAIAAQSAGIKINSIVYLSGANVAGTSGEFVNLTGSGFYNGATVFIQNNQCLTYYISSTGLQFRVPTTLSPGVYWVYVKNTDGAMAFKPNAIVISTSPTFTSPAAGSLGTVNSQNFLVYNFVATSDSAITYTIESGTLPPGLSLATSGNLSGTIPTSAVPSSPYYFTVRASDAEGQRASRSYVIAVQGTIGITSIIYPNNLSAASNLGGDTITVRGLGFLSGAIVRIGNQAPIAASVANSTLLTFTTTSGSVGTYELAVINPNGTFGNIANFYKYSSLPIWSGNVNLPNIESNLDYSANIYSFASVTSDSLIISRFVSNINLPAGITANANTGIVSGYTTVSSNIAYSVTITVVDAEGQSSTRTFLANIQPVPIISANTVASSIIDGGTYSILGNNFSNTATVYFDSILRSTTRIGNNQLDFQAPFIQPGTYVVYVQQGNVQISNPINWTVGELVTPFTLNVSGYLGQPIINSAFSRTIMSVNSAGAVSWSLVNGSLPPNITLATASVNTAVISGTVTGNSNINVYNFAIRATDATQQRVTVFYSLWVTDQAQTLSFTANFAVVAGGAGGGYGAFEGGGGGGAGGVLQGSKTYFVGNVDTVVVGAGGAQRASGSNSVFSANTAIGGGAGGDASINNGTGVSGGSGGGGTGYNTTRGGGAGTPGQGFAGGIGQWSGASRGGGGGGASGVGIDGNTSGAGGPSIFLPLFGANLAGGGGGAGSGGGTTGGPGGGGGASNGGQISPQIHSWDATPNTGSGGGGGTGWGIGSTAGAGGSGVVYIGYQSANQHSTGGIVFKSNGYVVHKVTSSSVFYAYNYFLTPNSTPIWTLPIQDTNFLTTTTNSLLIPFNVIAHSKAITYSVIGTLPPEFVFDTANLTIGKSNITANSSGVYSFRLRATDLRGSSSLSPNISITIEGNPTILSLNYDPVYSADAYISSVDTQTVGVVGLSFKSGDTVRIANVNYATTFVNSNFLTTTITPNVFVTTGNNFMYVFSNVAVSTPFPIVVRDPPFWVTASGNASGYFGTEEFDISYNYQAVSNSATAVSYTIESGTIPPGSTFLSNGYLYGSLTSIVSTGAWSFSIRATETQGQYRIRNFAFPVYTRPRITSISYLANSPNLFSNVGAEVKTIIGTGFSLLSNVLVGSTLVPATYNSETQITFVTPSALTGNTTLLVRNRNRTSSFAQNSDSMIQSIRYSMIPEFLYTGMLPEVESGIAFTYQLSAVSDTVITYSGISVNFGSEINYFSSNNTIAGNPIAGQSYSLSARVRATDTDQQYSEFVSNLIVKSNVLPTITSVVYPFALGNLNTGGNQVLVVRGTNFSTFTKLFLDGSELTFTFSNSTTVSANTVARPEGTYSLIATNSTYNILGNGSLVPTKTVSSSAQLVIYSKYPITISYPSGWDALAGNGGQTLTISGNTLAGLTFNANSIVYLDNIVIAKTLVNSTTLTISTPAKALGTYNIFVLTDQYYSGNASVNYNYVSTNRIGQAEFTTAGTYTWTAPVGVFSVSAVAIGGGGAGSVNGSNGGSGGGLGWKNNITVIPGQSYTVVVGAGGAQQDVVNLGTSGGDSYFISAGTVRGGGGKFAGQWATNPSNWAGGTYTGDGGGNGGAAGALWVRSVAGTGGGGAGGYTGNGGAGGSVNATDNLDSTGKAVAGSLGSGGGGHGGSSDGKQGSGASNPTGQEGAYAGGGTGLYGTGTVFNYTQLYRSGSGGSGGSDEVFAGGLYGGGGAGGSGGGRYYGTGGGSGAVRIIWGSGRTYPSTNTGDQYEGNIIPVTSSLNVEVFIVGGGGGGGYAGGTFGAAGGGGGAGGVVYTTYVLLPYKNYVISIGGGGTGGTGAGAGVGGSNSQNGSNTTFTEISTSANLIAIGGGSGGRFVYINSLNNYGIPGGSGGSGGGLSYAAGAGTATQPLQYNSRSLGWGSSVSSGYSVSGPGGGAGGGQSAMTIQIRGTSESLAGGGGEGESRDNQSRGVSTGGSGAGGYFVGVAGQPQINGSNAVANSGSGGGGGGYYFTYGPPFNEERGTGGAGGSGIVIVKYPTPQRLTGGNVTVTGNWVVHTFTSSGNISIT